MKEERKKRKNLIGISGWFAWICAFFNLGVFIGIISALVNLDIIALIFNGFLVYALILVYQKKKIAIKWMVTLLYIGIGLSIASIFLESRIISITETIDYAEALGQVSIAHGHLLRMIFYSTVISYLRKSKRVKNTLVN